MALLWGFYGAASAESPSVYYTVAPGDTLWSIAEDHYSVSEDLRPRIAEIQESNGLDGARVYPGMRLKLSSDAR